MMTGIPIENNIWSAYLLTAFLVIVGFAFYDIFHRRVPDLALVFFIPLAAAAPLIKSWFALDCGQPPLWLWPIFAKSLIGALLGFSIPLAAAIVTGGTGMGGGDIKFCGVLGLIYGPSGMSIVFLVSAVCAMVRLRRAASLRPRTVLRGRTATLKRPPRAPANRLSNRRRSETMGKVITVWGSPGSGKSMFSCILAKALTRDKRKAIIINAEISVPMLPVWLPDQIIQTNASVGQVLSSVEIDTSLVASHVTVLKSYPFIGLMGYSAGENPLSYPEIKYAMVLQLVNAAAKLVDFVILDCSSNMTNVFTPAAIESGDLVVRLLTPDLKGINYLKAHQPLLVDGRFHYDQHLTFAGMARPFHALDEMGYIIGGFDGLLPYSKEIDRCATEGGMFQAIKYCNPKYTASLNKVLDALEQMELAEQAAEEDPDEEDEFEEEDADE